MKVVSQTDGLVVIQLDKVTGKDIMRAPYVIPTHILIYNDRIEIRVKELTVDMKKKTKKFALNDLLLMNWVLCKIMEK